MYIYKEKSVFKDSILIILISILINIFILQPLIGGSIVALCILILLAALTYKADTYTAIFMVITILLQNFMLIIIAPYINSGVSSVFIASKEIFAYVVVATLVFRTGGLKLLFINKFMWVFIAILLISFITSSADLFVKVICIRQMLIPFVTFMFGVAVINADIYKILKVILYSCIFVSVFGIVEMTILGDEFWIKIGIQKYMSLKGFDAWVYNGLPGNYYTADLINWTGRMYRRMASILTDPLLTSHFLCMGFLYLLFKKDLFKNRKIRSFLIVLLGISIILTLSKGAFLILGVGFFLKVYKKNKLGSSIIGLIGVIGLIFIIKNNLLYSVGAHAGGLVDNFKSMSLLGKGIAKVGNFALIYSDSGSDIGTGESLIGTILGQVGIIGVSIYIGFYVSIIKRMLNFKDKDIAYFISSLMIGTFLETFLSESAVSFIGNGIYFMIVGMLYRLSIKKIN